MKKIIIFLICVFAVTSVCAYDECESAGGTEITRNVHGATNAPSTCTPEKCPATTKTFCKSGQSMNWWTAFNWCASIGGKLAKFEEMCPGVQSAKNDVADACPALKGVGGNNWVWSNVGYGSNSALLVNLSSGAVPSDFRYRAKYSALCE